MSPLFLLPKIATTRQKIKRRQRYHPKQQTNKIFRANYQNTQSKNKKMHKSTLYKTWSKNSQSNTETGYKTITFQRLKANQPFSMKKVSIIQSYPIIYKQVRAKTTHATQAAKSSFSNRTKQTIWRKIKDLTPKVAFLCFKTYIFVSSIRNYSIRQIWYKEYPTKKITREFFVFLFI